MRILVIGGTVFVGRHLVAEALARGHRVTLFHRGLENLGLFPDAERVLGDRRHDLARLSGRTFDAVIDTCGYQPADVGAAALALRHVPVYVYLSSITAYRAYDPAGTTEDHPIHDEPANSAEVSGATLGRLKAACERAVTGQFGAERSLLIRCGRIVGSHDVASRSRADDGGNPVTDVDYDAFAGRLPYWPLRAAEGGEFIAPRPEDGPLQLLDVRDFATWLISMAERGQGGTFNATGPVTGSLTMRQMVETSVAAAGSRAGTPVWIDEKFLLDRGVRPGTGLPLWTPHAVAHRRGHYTIDVGHARRAGLTSRPLSDTICDILRWARENPASAVAPDSPILTKDREAALLGQWSRG
jgi:2'-hydroxyisoflavone reductase